MDENYICKTILLSDTPSKKDEFGSHERVSKAIAELIKKDNGGKSIALTGSWGSGKSTVIELIKNHLDNETEVFVFDAWSHEGDPLRRTFLEQLIDFAIYNKWVDEDKWQNKKCELSRKIKRQKIKSSPVLTFQGKILGISTLLVPLGLALVSLNEKTIPIEILNLTQFPVWLPYIGIILSLSPLISCIFLLIYNKCKGEQQDTALLSLILNNSQTVENSETVETPNPTSIEFLSIFEELLKASLQNNNRRKLVLVVDNLDRIDTKDALEIWATMRTFFDFNSNGGNSWLSKLWLIVPFDPIALEKLWHVNGNEKNNENKKLVKSFKDKSFQITFDVAPPVFTDWKDFLISQLNEAFPDHDSKDFHIIYRLYRLNKLSNEGFPTPRDLKLFVNQIGTLHRQWYDEIPLPIQALYIILSQDESDFSIKLTQGNVLNEHEKQIMNSYYKKKDKEIMEYLAALHFNVPIMKSLQVLLEKPIEEALYNGDSKRIKELSESTGFSQVCEHVIEGQCKDWLKENNQTICIAADNLSHINHIHDTSWKRTWDLLYENANSIESLEFLDENVGKGLVSLFKYKPNEDFAKKIIRLAVDTTPHFEEDNHSIEILDNRIQKWCKSVFVILRELLNDNYHNTINEYFTLKCNASTYIEIISRIENDLDWDKILPYFKPKEQPTEIVSILVKKLNEGRFSEVYCNAVISMLKVEQKWPWSSLILGFAQRLQNQHISSQEVTSDITTLLNLNRKEIPDAKKTLDNLVNQGTLLSYLSFSSDNPLNTALCLVPILTINPEVNPKQHVNNSNNGLRIFNKIMENPKNHIKVVESFSNFCLHFSLIKDIIKLPDEFPKTLNFVSEVMEYLAKREDIDEILSPSEIISNSSFLSRRLSDSTYENLIKKSIEKSSLINVLIERDFDSEISQIYLISLKNVEAIDNQQVIKFVIDGIKGIKKETWLSELKNNNQKHLLGLLIEVVKLENKLDLNTSLEDALLSHAEYIIRENIEDNFLIENYIFLYDALDNNSKITFLKRLLDIIIISENKTDNVIKVYGELLKDCKILYEYADNLMLKGFKKFLSNERRSLIELKWLKETLFKCPKIYHGREDELRKDFERRITDAWVDDQVVEKREIYESIAEKFEIQLPEREEQNISMENE